MMGLKQSPIVTSSKVLLPSSKMILQTTLGFDLSGRSPEQKLVRVFNEIFFFSKYIVTEICKWSDRAGDGTGCRSFSPLTTFHARRSDSGVWRETGRVLEKVKESAVPAGKTFRRSRRQNGRRGESSERGSSRERGNGRHDEREEMKRGAENVRRQRILRVSIIITIIIIIQRNVRTPRVRRLPVPDHPLFSIAFRPRKVIFSSSARPTSRPPLRP